MKWHLVFSKNYKDVKECTCKFLDEVSCIDGVEIEHISIKFSTPEQKQTILNLAERYGVNDFTDLSI